MIDHEDLAHLVYHASGIPVDDLDSALRAAFILADGLPITLHEEGEGFRAECEEFRFAAYGDSPQRALSFLALRLHGDYRTPDDRGEAE